MKKLTATGLLCAILIASPVPGSASDKQELLELRNTVLNLVDALVKQGVLNPEQAQALVKKAEADAATQAAAQVAAAAPATPASAADATAENAVAAGGSKVVRVPYVPEFVKREIRDQVRAELRQDVLTDVAEKAKQEKWGTPDALPAWLSSIKLSGDARVRNEYDKFGNDNADRLSAQNLYLDVLKVNAAGGIGKAGASAFLNTSQDSNRWVERVRLGLQANIADHWSFETQATTGNQANPVSTNQVLGNTNQRFNIQIDRAQLLYDLPAEQAWSPLDASIKLAVGRIANPWVSTNLLWDEDLNFDGVALTLRHAIGQGGGLAGVAPSGRSIFATAGLFPLQQVDFVGQDKWLAGGQVGAAWEFENQNKIQLASAYYDYIHMVGRRNTLGSTLRNGSQPQFLQKGNLLYNIANDPNLDGGANDQVFALASDYQLVDLTLSLDLAYLSPYHVIFNGDIVKNVGFNRDEILARTGGNTYLYPIRDRTLGWQFDVVVGWPQITKFGDWQVTAGYRYLQGGRGSRCLHRFRFSFGWHRRQGLSDLRQIRLVEKCVAARQLAVRDRNRRATAQHRRAAVRPQCEILSRCGRCPRPGP